MKITGLGGLCDGNCKVKEKASVDHANTFESRGSRVRLSARSFVAGPLTDPGTRPLSRDDEFRAWRHEVGVSGTIFALTSPAKGR
jgi:hypothetical protein